MSLPKAELFHPAMRHSPGRSEHEDWVLDSGCHSSAVAIAPSPHRSSIPERVARPEVSGTCWPRIARHGLVARLRAGDRARIGQPIIREPGRSDILQCAGEDPAVLVAGTAVASLLLRLAAGGDSMCFKLRNGRLTQAFAGMAASISSGRRSGSPGVHVRKQGGSRWSITALRLVAARSDAWHTIRFRKRKGAL